MNSPDRWYHKVNPCDIARVRVLAPIGDALAGVWDVFTAGTDCACCLGTRFLVYTVVIVSIARIVP